MLKFLEIIQPKKIGLLITDKNENNKEPFMVVYLKNLKYKYPTNSKRKKRSLNWMKKSIAERPERRLNPYSGIIIN